MRLARPASSLRTDVCSFQTNATGLVCVCLPQINLDHPGFAEHRERLHGRMRNRHMTEVAMVAQTFVRPPFNPSSMCFICLHSLPRFSGTRHHCRRCGNTVCQDHSSYRGRLLVWQLEPNTGEERVCVACYKDLLRLRKAETSAAEDVRRANLERRAQRKLRARRRASQRGGLRVDSGAARRGSAGSASDNVAAQPGPPAAGKAHAGQPPLVDDRLAVTVPLPNAPRADMDMGEEEVDIGAQLIDLSQYKMDVMLFRRPATSKLKVMKEPRDERLVQVMVAAATQYALLMKEKLADEVRGGCGDHVASMAVLTRCAPPRHRMLCTRHFCTDDDGHGLV